MLIFIFIILSSICLVFSKNLRIKFLGIAIPICGCIISLNLKGYKYRDLDFAFFFASLMIISIAATISHNTKIRFFGIAIPLCVWLGIGGINSIFDRYVFNVHLNNDLKIFLTILLLVSSNCLFLVRLIFKKDIYGSRLRKIGILLSSLSFLILISMLSVHQEDIYNIRYISGKIYTVIYFVNVLGISLFLCDNSISLMISWFKNTDNTSPRY